MAKTRRTPRVSPELTPLTDPSAQDDALWEAVEISGHVTGPFASRIEIIGSRMRGARLIGLQLDQLRVVDTVVEDCDFSGTVLSGLMLDAVSFLNCRLSAADLSGARLHNVSFAGCKLDEVNLRMVSGEGIKFEDCLLAGADFYQASLPGTGFFDCDLSVTEFSKVDVTGARFHGSRLEDVKGAGYLKGITIDSTQIVPLALPVFAALGITIDDTRGPDDDPRR